MKGLEFFGLYFICGIILIIIVAAIAGAIWRVAEKPGHKHFVRRSRVEFQKRYPYLNAEKFTPIITKQSPCCQAMMWEYWNIVDQYFCDHCGKRYKEEYDWFKKQTTGKLEPANERDLSALNELFKNWTEQDASKQSRP